MQVNGNAGKARVSGRDAHKSKRPGTEAGPQRGPAPRAGGKDAPPSNTASHTCNAEFFRPLRWGTDSLYVSYAGKLHTDMLARFDHLKGLAQSTDPTVKAQAQYPLGEHLFEVKDKGAPLFPYVLEDNAFRIQFSRPSKALVLPMAYAKIASGFLSHVSTADAEKSLYALLDQLGEMTGTANVSRIDLFVDFVSFENMESWTRHAWVTRATTINAYSVDGKFSGWSVGSGGVLSARLYNKRLEIEASGKRYLFDLWREAGWTEGEPVWRLEFQFNREALTRQGLSRLGEVLGNLSGLWSYATTEWLRLTLPDSGDQTRSRWPVHPLWGYLTAIDWESDGGPLFRRYSPARLPGDEKLFALGLSVMLSFMAREGITDLYRGQDAYVEALYRHHEQKSYALGLPFDAYVAEKVALKAREFNTILNNPNLEAERKALETKRQADAYRTASNGG